MRINLLLTDRGIPFPGGMERVAALIERNTATAVDASQSGESLARTSAELQAMVGHFRLLERR